MSDLGAFRRRFRYHAWATATLAEAVGDVPDALRPFAHALVADRVWLLRLRGEPTEGVALWTDLDGDECRALARRNAEAYTRLLDGGVDLDAPASGQTSGGARPGPVRPTPMGRRGDERRAAPPPSGQRSAPSWTRVRFIWAISR